jgi:hypothetical protein
VTTLIAWSGIDSRGPASLYLAADSKFSWTETTTWQHGRKLYASRVVPDILGYCGDVLFATQALSQALELIEVEILFKRESSFSSRLEILEKFLRRSFETYPADQRRDFSITYATRNGEGMTSTFSLGEIAWSRANGWSTRHIPIPTRSAVMFANGSGATAFTATLNRWVASDVGGTSRAVFSAFCDHIRSVDDTRTGGAPQLVGLYRSRGPAMTFGVVWDGVRYVSGVALHEASGYGAVQWRDQLFQICDPLTLDVSDGAQRHARPTGL